ncbi:MAG: hypothetical protein ABL962_21810, partial [Fimbriimonadaceae bacterium]
TRPYTMLSVILACVALQTPQVQESSYTLRNMTLAYFMHKNPMQIGGQNFPNITFIEKAEDRPTGFEAWLLPDKSNNTLRIFGSSQQVKQIPQYLEMFDIKPKAIKISIAARHLEFDLMTSYDVTTLNNRPFGVSEAEIGLDFTLRPRVNDDGSVSFLFTMKTTDGKSKEASKRFRPGEDWVVGFSSDGKPDIFNEAPNPSKTVRIRYEILGK